MKRSTLDNHIKSVKRNECKKKLKTKQGKEIEYLQLSKSMMNLLTPRVRLYLMSKGCIR